MSLYISFEGLDACGKTTQSKSLVERLLWQGAKAVWSREPGSPLIDLNLRDIILSHKKIAPQTLELLLQADRAEHTTKIKELLADDTWVISDRSALSGIVYAETCGHDLNYIQGIMEFSIQRYPDLIFYLDIPVEEAEKRRSDRGEAPTREEIKGLEFKEKIRKNFRFYVERGFYDNRDQEIEIVQIDATGSIGEISFQVDKEIERAMVRFGAQKSLKTF